jgi:spore coat protein CotF
MKIRYLIPWRCNKMAGIIDSMKAAKNKLDDKSMAADMLAASKAASTAYMLAVLESPTPELRAMLRGALNQTLDEYSVLMDLSLNKTWIKPYDLPEQQLTESFKQSQTVIS